MDFMDFAGHWKGREVVAFCGPVKYRGILREILDGGFLILENVAVIIPAGQETTEYESCILNVAELSGLACEERVGRGEGVEEY